MKVVNIKNVAKQHLGAPLFTGEVHWHGAAQGDEFTHISVTRAHTKLTQVEK